MPVLKRLFVAIAIPAVVKREVRELLDAEILAAPGMKLITPEHWHLTVSFIGDVPLAKVSGVGKALMAVAQAHALFNLYTDGLTLFPNERIPRVVALTLKDHVALTTVQAAVTVATAPWRDPEQQQRFHPHVSILRLKPGADVTVLQELLATPYERRFEVPDLLLLSSNRQDERTVYTEEGRYALQPADA